MTRYILDFRVATSDQAIFSVLMEQIQAMVNDCKPEEIDYHLSQETREEAEEGKK